MTLRISRATFWILSSLYFSGCALFGSAAPPPQTMDPMEQVYLANFDSVWLATQKALAAYPMRVNNMDLKILETDYIKSNRYWNPPHIPRLGSGDKYKLVVKVMEGEIEGKGAQKVSVSKEVYRQKDFFAPKNRIPSTGLEERSLLYRIERELIIEKALDEAQKQLNSNSDF
ncbi:MAG: hypothetical protein HRT45_03590 [Bdellovibrionales bacterium]|nr:hypothetical protein [Bdellovibrionales bacterium]